MKTLKKGFLALGISLCSLSYHFAFAADELPKFDCTLTDQITADDDAGDAKDIFTASTPNIYFYCDSDDITKGQKLRSVWIADDTHNVAPANYKIDEKSYEITNDLKDGQTFTGKFSISKPNNGWPVGSYHVDLYVDGDLAQSVKFTVK